MTGAPARIVQGGRAKAYRPLPDADRRRAIRAGLAAYRAGDFFEAHELLEPAWMGTADLPERELLQGLIKLAAAYVHAVRGNATGVEKNLAGARERLAGAAGATVRGVDVRALVATIDAHLGALRTRGPADLEREAIFAIVPPPTLGGAR
jgi:predicted metal-dependent hydrolase